MNVKGIIAAALGASAISVTNISRVPDGWSLASTGLGASECYTTRYRTPETQENELRIICRRATDGAFSLIQTFAAEPFRGKRMQFLARMRTHDLQGRAGLLIRVESENKGVLAFDDMRTRPVNGDTDWAEYRVSLDIDEPASAITIGFLVEGGPGAARIDRIRFEEVPADNWELSIRLRSHQPTLPLQPQNLNLRP